MARKRFGRNQKRRLREEAKKWKDSYDRNYHSARLAIDRYNRVKDAIQRVSKNSALLPPEEIPDDRFREYWYIAKTISPSGWTEGGFTAGAYERVELTACKVEAAIREAGLHLMLRYGAMNIRYQCSWMMTEEVLNHPEIHVEEIARMIAMEIARVKEERENVLTK